MRRQLLLLACCTLPLAAAPADGDRQPAPPAPAAPAAPPNILLIIADDLGAMDTTPYHPATFYQTPALKALADTGTRFTRGYAACPVCSPSRSAVMTGQWPARTRNTDYFGAPNGIDAEAVPDNYDAAVTGRFGRHHDRPLWPAPYLSRLAQSHTTLAEALRQHGYATFFAGKWHLGPQGSWPEDHGFDVNRGGTDRGAPSGAGRYFPPYDNPRLPDGPPTEHLPDRLATETARFIAEHKDRPFFACLAFYSVHVPLIGRPDLVEKHQARRAELKLTDESAPEPPRRNRTTQSHAVYAAMVEALDAAVGKVLAALDEHGLTNRTLVVFTSDNGGLSTAEGSPTSNLPLRAGKGWLYEGGIRVPVIARWPGVTRPGTTSDWPVTSTDYSPTFLAAAGLALLPDQHRDGVSFLPALKDPAATDPGRVLFWHYPHWGNQGGTPGAAVRKGDWKLVQWYWRKPAELFNLAADPGEQRNLANDHPAKAAELTALLGNLRAETEAVMPTTNPAAADKPFTRW